MANRTLLERTGMTVEDLERIYHESGSLEATCRVVGCSKPTLVKYLRHVPKDPTPWKTKVNRDRKRLATAEWQDRVFQEVQKAIIEKRVWVDSNQRRIPKGFIKAIYFELPEYEGPVVPLYTQLWDGTRLVLLHIIQSKVSRSRQPEQP